MLVGKGLGVFHFAPYGLERAAIELRSWSLNSLKKVSESLKHLPGPNASLAVPSATQVVDLSGLLDLVSSPGDVEGS